MNIKLKFQFQFILCVFVCDQRDRSPHSLPHGLLSHARQLQFKRTAVMKTFMRKCGLNSFSFCTKEHLAVSLFIVAITGCFQAKLPRGCCHKHSPKHRTRTQLQIHNKTLYIHFCSLLPSFAIITIIITRIIKINNNTAVITIINRCELSCFCPPHSSCVRGCFRCHLSSTASSSAGFGIACLPPSY